MFKKLLIVLIGIYIVSNQEDVYAATYTEQMIPSTYQHYREPYEKYDIDILYNRFNVQFQNGNETIRYQKVKTFATSFSNDTEMPYRIQMSNGKEIESRFLLAEGALNGQRRTLQGITFGEQDDVYISYGTGDLTTYGYIYHYDESGQLLTTSPKLKIGHGQGISYMNERLYVLADVKEGPSFIYTYNPTQQFQAIESWVLPDGLKPTVMTMKDANTAIIAQKYNIDEGYEIIELFLDSETGVATVEKRLLIPGVIGHTYQKELQGLSYYKGYYYIVTNGFYAKVNRLTSTRLDVAMHVKREVEGMDFNHRGELGILFNKPNALFTEKR